MKLIHGDCLKEMFDIPDNSIDMVCCDMPYGTTACKWDTVLPLDMLWHHYRRICKENATIVLFCAQPFTTTLINSNLKWFKYDWVWVKSRAIGHLVCKYRPMEKKEGIAVFGKGRINYYPQKTKRKKIVIDSRKAGNVGRSCQHLGFKNKKDRTTAYEYKNPTTVLEFNNEHNANTHPTQKPVALIEYLIKTYTNEGDTVLDNCMGSGTTGVACKNLNRNFIGIELDKKYFEIAKTRIESTQYNQQINRTQKDAPVI